MLGWTRKDAIAWVRERIKIGYFPAMYWFFLLVGLLFAVVYLFFFMREVPGAAKERFGELEPLPENVGTWVVEQNTEAARLAQSLGQVRETRLWQYDEQNSRSNRLVRQIRYRGLESGVVERVEPDEPVKRQRRFD